MAKGAKFKKYARRTPHAKVSSRAWIVVTAVIAFLILSFVISVAVGIALGKKAENIEKSKLDIAVSTYYSGDRRVLAVDTGIYRMDYDSSALRRGKVGLSLCLQDDIGGIGYRVELGFTPDGISFGEDLLYDHVEYIKKRDGYVCAYMYVKALDIKNSYERELYKAFEMALINNASASGVDEILLILPAVTDSKIDEIERYVSEASKASTGAAVGVLLTSELLAVTESDVYYASRLRAVCDFAAIDLRGATESTVEEILLKNEFYIRSYPLRGVFCESNEDVADIARELGMTSIQIIEDAKNVEENDDEIKK
jgi:hypothetical protein